MSASNFAPPPGTVFKACLVAYNPPPVPTAPINPLVHCDSGGSRTKSTASKVISELSIICCILFTNTPSFLDGKTQYTNSEMLEILAEEEWQNE